MLTKFIRIFVEYHVRGFIAMRLYFQMTLISIAEGHLEINFSNDPVLIPLVSFLIRALSGSKA